MLYQTTMMKIVLTVSTSSLRELTNTVSKGIEVEIDGDRTSKNNQIVTKHVMLVIEPGLTTLSHHVFTFSIFVEFTFLFGGGILVLLVLRNKIVHVGFGFSEFHFIHTFTSVPM